MATVGLDLYSFHSEEDHHIPCTLRRAFLRALVRTRFFPSTSSLSSCSAAGLLRRGGPNNPRASSGLPARAEASAVEVGNGRNAVSCIDYSIIAWRGGAGLSGRREINSGLQLPRCGGAASLPVAAALAAAPVDCPMTETPFPTWPPPPARLRSLGQSNFRFSRNISV